MQGSLGHQVHRPAQNLLQFIREVVDRPPQVHAVPEDVQDIDVAVRGQSS